MSSFRARAGRKLVRWRLAAAQMLPGDRDPAHELARIGLFDLAHYRAQFAEEAKAPRTLRDAVRDYIAEGRAAERAFHPFIEPEWWLGRESLTAEERLGVEEALVGRHLFHIVPSPYLSDTVDPPEEMVEKIRAAARDPRLQRLRSDVTSAVERAHRDAGNRGDASGVDWDRVRRSLADRVAARVSILIPTYQDWRMTVGSARAALAGAGDADVEIVIVDNGSHPVVHRRLIAELLAEPRVRVLRASRNTNFSGGMNIGVAASKGEFILLLNNDAVLADGWLAPLREALDDPDVRGVQSLLLYPDIDRVQAAGTMFLGDGVIPWHFLAGHPIEDVERVRTRRYCAITAAVMMLRAAELVDLEGFDERYRNGYEDVDLCLRMLQRPDDHFTVAVDSRAVHPEGSSQGRSRFDTANRKLFLETWGRRMPAPEGWRYNEIGMRLAAMRPHTFVDEVPVMISDPHLVRPERLVDSGPAAARPCLRWTLCLSVEPSSPVLVDALRDDLEALGQEVVSFRGGVRFADGLDDVLVAFAATAPFTPRSATVNVLAVADNGVEVRDAWDAVLAPGDPTTPYDPSAGEADRRRVLLQLIDRAASLQAARYLRTAQHDAVPASDL